MRCLAVTPSGELDGKKIDCWDEIINTVTDIAGYISEIEYFTASIILTDGGFVIDSIDTNPDLPPIAHSDALNDYLWRGCAKSVRASS